MISAEEALKRLKEGNQKFVSDNTGQVMNVSQARREELAKGQAPFAIILGCSDSRVPAEIIFNQGLGDLFVIRVAGNIAGPSQIGSIEYAAVHLKTKLIVVLGHSYCGAVVATIEKLKNPENSLSKNLLSIVDPIESSVKSLVASNLKTDEQALLKQAIRSNIDTSIKHLREESTLLTDVTIVGAEYSLETGKVTFF